MTFHLRRPPLLLRHLQHNRLAKRRTELPVVVLTSMKAAGTDCYNAPLFHPSKMRYRYSSIHLTDWKSVLSKRLSHRACPPARHLPWVAPNSVKYAAIAAA